MVTSDNQKYDEALRRLEFRYFQLRIEQRGMATKTIERGLWAQA